MRLSDRPWLDKPRTGRSTGKRISRRSRRRRHHPPTMAALPPRLLQSTPATSAHDPLQACAIALRNGHGRAVIVTVDSVGVSRETLDAAKLEAAGKTGWKPEQMLIAATHTHSAPSSGGGGPAPRVAYAKRFSDGVAQAITDAIANLEPPRRVGDPMKFPTKSSIAAGISRRARCPSIPSAKSTRSK